MRRAALLLLAARTAWTAAPAGAAAPEAALLAVSARSARRPAYSGRSPGQTRRASSNDIYSLLPADATCDEAGLGDVSSSTECFGDAMGSVGLAGIGNVTTTYVSAPLGFSCIYHTGSNDVIFSLSTGSATRSDPSWRYICPGAYTTTASSTSRTTVSTTIATATAWPDSSLLPPGLTCYDLGLDDVPSSAGCFDNAAPAVGVTVPAQTYIAGTAFKISCVYDASSGTIFFSDSVADGTEASSQYQFICLGTYSTTHTSTATSSTTRSSTSATSSTTVTSTTGTSSTTRSTSATSSTSVTITTVSSSTTRSSTSVTSSSTLTGTTGTTSTTRSSTSATSSTTRSSISASSSITTTSTTGTSSTSATSRTSVTTTTRSSSTTRSSTSATSSSTATNSTTSATATAWPGSSLLPPGLTCYDVGLDDVPSSTNCFDNAAPGVGVTASAQTYIAGTAFKVSCVYDASSGTMFFSDSVADGTEASSQYHFICLGTYSTTHTSTAISSTTRSSTSATSSTSVTSTTASSSPRGTTGASSTTLGAAGAGAAAGLPVVAGLLAACCLCGGSAPLGLLARRLWARRALQEGVPSPVSGKTSRVCETAPGLARQSARLAGPASPDSPRDSRQDSRLITSL